MATLPHISNTLYAMPHPEAEDETVRDLRRALTCQAIPEHNQPKSQTPTDLRSNEDLLAPEVGRWRDVAQPGGFRRHHVRSHAGAGRRISDYARSSLLELLTPEVSLPDLQDLSEVPDQCGEVLQGEAATHSVQGSSNFATVAIIVKLAFGSAFLITPMGFKSAGILGGPSCLIVVYIFMIISMLKLIECHRTTNAGRAYADLGVALGSWGKGYITGAMVLLAFGFNCIWCVTCAQSSSAILGSWSPTKQLWVSFPVVVPLTLVRKLKVFTVTNLVGITFCFVTVIYLAVFAIRHVLQDGVQPVKLLNTDNADILLWIGTCGYIFEFILLVLPIYEAAADKAMMPKLLVGATTTVTLVYIIFGCLFYSAMGSDTKDLATLNLPSGSWDGKVFPSLFMIVGVATMPLNFFTIFQTYEPQLTWSECVLLRKWEKNAVRILVTLAVYTVTWLGGQKLLNFLALVGGLLGSNLALTVPSMLHLAVCKPKGLVWCWDVAILLVSLVIMGTSTYQAIKTWK